MNPANKSTEIKTLAAALCKAQAVMKGASKDKSNPHLKTRYADLASVWDACREPLSSNGLSVVQLVEGDDAKISVTTVLMHESGEWISSKLTLNAVKVAPQEQGSASTYARRYGLAAMVGVCPDDDDAEAAQGRGKENRAAKDAPPPEAPDGTEEKGKELLAKLKAAKRNEDIDAVRVEMAKYKWPAGWKKSLQEEGKAQRERIKTAPLPGAGAPTAKPAGVSTYVATPWVLEARQALERAKSKEEVEKIAGTPGSTVEDQSAITVDVRKALARLEPRKAG